MTRHPLVPPPEAMRDFAGGPENPHGMRVQGFWVEGADRVEGEWTVASPLDGWAGLAQGTAFAALADIGAVWAMAVLVEEWGLTTRMEVRFLAPLRMGERVTLVGRVVEAGPKSATLATEVVKEDGTVAQRATVEMQYFRDAAMVEKLLGRPLSDFSRAYLAAPKGRRRALMLERGRELAR